MCRTLWGTLRRKAFRRTPVEAMMAMASEETKLRRVLTLFDLLLLGIGSAVGSGVFVLTGEVAREHAGPAVILSYALAAVAALFAGLCYAEFAADIPIAGASYNYVLMVFGEFMAWLAAGSCLFETVLSTSTIAKGIAGYFSTLIGIDSSALVMTFEDTDVVVIDILGASIVGLLTVLLISGVRESFNFNSVVTAISVVVILFTIGASSTKIDMNNYTPFIPAEFGVVGAARGASIVFFSYLGFEAMAMVAEESRNPRRDLPLAMVITLVVVSVLYMLMAAALVGMIPYQSIDVMAAFSSAFRDVGWDWASRIVSFGALCGILTSLFGSMCAQCRLTMVLAREGFLPEFLATVNGRTGTPITATLVCGFISSFLTLLLDIDTLSSMVSVGVLFLFCLVCSALLWRRYCKTDDRADAEDARCAKPSWVGWRLVMLFVLSILEGLTVDREWPLWVWISTVACFFGVVASFATLPVVFKSTYFSLTIQPLTACLAYIRFVVWLSVMIVTYLVYGVHHTKERSDDTNSLLRDS